MTIDAECGVALIRSYNYLVIMSHRNDTRCSLSPVTQKYLVFQQRQPLRQWRNYYRMCAFQHFNDTDLCRLWLSNNANDIEYKIYCI